jgi:hypothetical protein
MKDLEREEQLRDPHARNQCESDREASQDLARGAHQ